MCESILPALALCEGNLEGGPGLAEGWKMHPENGVLRSPNSAGPVFEHSLEQPLSSRKTPVPSPGHTILSPGTDTVYNLAPLSKAFPNPKGLGDQSTTQLRKKPGRRKGTPGCR